MHVARWRLTVIVLAAMLAATRPGTAQEKAGSFEGPVPAAGLTLTTGESGSVLSLNGTAFHRTTRSVLNERLVETPGSDAVLVLWDEVAASRQTAHHYAVSVNGRDVVRTAETSYVLGLRHHQFDPLVGVPAVDPMFAASPSSILYLVQFHAQSLEAFRNQIEALGGRVYNPVAQHAHVVRMSPAIRAEVENLPYVRWVGSYDVLYRLDETLVSWVRTAAEAAEPQRVSIMAFEPGMTDQQVVADRVRALGGVVNVHTPDGYRMEATLSAAQLLDVAAMDQILFIDPWGGPGEHDMDIARQIGGAVPILSSAGITGQGVRGEIHDTEVFATHQQWAGQTPLVHGTNGNSGTHGSSCYGINFATGTGNAQATGMMPNREQGIFYWYPQSTQFGGSQTRLAANTEATNPAGPYRSVFQTSSVGSSQTTQYTTISADTDNYLFLLDYLSCQSQSNTGNQTSRPQAWAKNIVAIGGIGHQNTLTRADDSYPGSSIGPATDGRMKPELAHFYDSIFTTTAGTTSYTNFGGTSGATPIACGHFGLLMQMWHVQTFQGFGGGPSVFADRPKSTTARALVINTAFPYNWLAGGANGTLTRPVQGWGMPDLGSLYNLRDSTFIVDESDVITPFQTIEYTVNVLPGTPALRATMVYSDPQGNPANQSQHRVNDLNLRVTSPTSVSYWGNNGLNAGLLSTAGGAADDKNTVENVFIQNPVAGVWRVEVIGASIIQDAHLETVGVLDADFGLVVTGVEPFLPALTIELPNGTPTLIPPGAATNIDVVITEVGELLVPGSAKLHYRTTGAGAYAEVVMTPAGGPNYVATLPAFSCGDTPEFYFSARGDQGTTVTNPATAPAEVYDAAVGALVLYFEDNFETNMGWTVSGDASDGHWERGVPVNGSRGDPPTDCDGSGQAYVTGNRLGNSDVDNGCTILTSPVFDLSSGGVIEYCYWLNDIPAGPMGPDDGLYVEVATDAGGTNWTEVRYYDTASSQWRNDSIVVGVEVPASSTVRIRFRACDVGAANTVEAGLDAVRIERVQCQTGCPTILGDMDGDGDVDGDDVPGFTDANLTPPFYHPCADLAAPFGVLDPADTAAFVQALLTP